MPFMDIECYETDYYIVDGPIGIDIVPEDLIESFEELPKAGRDMEIPTENRTYRESKIIEAFQDFTENANEIYNIERCHGWIARYSAHGYMDCTNWVEGETEKEAIDYLKEVYGDNED